MFNILTVFLLIFSFANICILNQKANIIDYIISVLFGSMISLTFIVFRNFFDITFQGVMHYVFLLNYFIYIFLFSSVTVKKKIVIIYASVYIVLVITAWIFVFSIFDILALFVLPAYIIFITALFFFIIIINILIKTLNRRHRPN